MKPAFTLITALLLAPLVTLCSAESAKTTGTEFPPKLVEFGPASEKPLLAGTGTNTWDRMVRERGWIMCEDGQWHMWFTGYNDDITKAKHWKKHPGNPILRVSPIMPGAGSGTVVYDGKGLRYCMKHPDVFHLPKHEIPGAKP